MASKPLTSAGKERCNREKSRGRLDVCQEEIRAWACLVSPATGRLGPRGHRVHAARKRVGTYQSHRAPGASGCS